jgi:hypothetical protein
MSNEPNSIDAMECGLTEQELARLRRALHRARQAELRSSQHECWAWTRLEACLREESTARASTTFWRWAAAGSLAALAAALILTGSSTSSSPTVPVAESQNPKVWASGFHSADAHADVIWANGYDYIPASYSLK